jgi:hypothetical protein
MAKEATIRFRCSKELKARLEAMADAREQSVSDFVRGQILDLMAGSGAAAIGMRIAEEPPGDYRSNPAGPVRQKKAKTG